MTDACANGLNERRRCFWTTQPDGCGTRDDTCGNECAQPGMSISNGQISSNDWIRGLMLNILNTDKRRDDSACGVNPAAINGHWSESFIDSESGLYGGASRGYRVGTGLRYIDTARYRIREVEALIQAEITSSMNKLVTLGVAQSVDVTVEYAGNHSFTAEIVAYGPNNAPYGRVALLGRRDETAGYHWSC